MGMIVILAIINNLPSLRLRTRLRLDTNTTNTRINSGRPRCQRIIIIQFSRKASKQIRAFEFTRIYIRALIN